MYNATNSAPHLPSVHRVAALHKASLRNSAQRFVCYFAALRFATPLDVPLRSSSLLNDLFVTTQLVWPRRAAAHCLSPQLNDLFVTTQLNELRLDVSPRVAPHRSAPQLNDLFVPSQRNFARRFAPHQYASHLCLSQLNDLFVNLLSRLDTTLCNEPRRNLPRRDARQLNATICLSLRSLAQRVTAQRSAYQRISTQRFVCYAAPRRNSTFCSVTRRNTTQRTETLTRKTNVQTFETNFGNV